jgi:phenylpropionate dioxygenase-like ring-hydroxylating dioxygenase large terminal subunit
MSRMQSNATEPAGTEGRHVSASEATTTAAHATGQEHAEVASNKPTVLPIPNGWFAVAWSKDLTKGEVLRARYFDEELVLFRTRSGEAKALNAYCPHMGAHLAEGGRVIGESVRCPFHGWQFDDGGACVAIPYTKRIPQRARVRAWDVQETNGMIFLWHHADGEPPSWEVPVMPEIGHPDWTEPRSFELKVAVHLQDMHENNCDPVHFHYVHKNTDVPPSEVSYADNGRFMRMTSTYEKETLAGTFPAVLERDSWGLGLSAVRLKGIPEAGLLMFSSTSPVDAGHTVSRWLFTVTENLVDLVGEDFIEGLSTGVRQDLRIWENKIHRADPALCDADEYLVEFRKWVRQFYSRPAGGTS